MSETTGLILIAIGMGLTPISLMLLTMYLETREDKLKLQTQKA